MSSKRQLAAIMFTDIEGYTSLMQQDEAIAIGVRNNHREIFDSNTSEFNGEVVQYFGDGTLSIFKSSVEAVQCAIKMQLSFIEKQLPIRIGIHVGDIVYTEEDIVGDAVNLASRIESCAVPGSVLISDKVHDQIRSHQAIKSTFLDAYEFKNVETTLPLFAISNEGLVVPDPQKIKGKLKEKKVEEKSSVLIKKSHLFAVGALLLLAIFYLIYNMTAGKSNSHIDNSIAVLPFENLSIDEDSEIFRDGMTEDILTYLSKINDLKVISRTSVMKFKDTKKSAPEIAKELGVSYILEGSIRKYGDKVRVTAQLIEADGDDHIWAKNYDKTLTDIFEIQTEVAQEIADALKLNLSFEEQQSLSAVATQNIEAYKLFLRGRKEADKRNRESIAKSIELYRQALILDPNYAEAMAEIANSVYLETYHANRDPIEASSTANEYLNRAEAISNKVSRIYSVRGLIYNIEGNKEEALKAFQKAVKISPNDVTARQQFSTFYYYNGEYKKQLDQAKIAYTLDPLSFVTANSYFTALVENDQFDEAEKLMKMVEKESDSNNTFVINRAFFRLYTATSDHENTITYLKKLVQEEIAFNRFLAFSYGKIGDTVNAYKVIEKIKLLDIDEEDGKSHQLAVGFAGLKEADSVFYYLDTIRNNRSGLLYREIPAFFDFIRQDPRFPKLLEAHNIVDD